MTLPPPKVSSPGIALPEDSARQVEEAALLLDSPPPSPSKQQRAPSAPADRASSVPAELQLAYETVVICSEEFEQHKDIVSELKVRTLRAVPRRMTRYGPDLILDPATCVLVSGTL
jgi:hypothetical protein